MIRALLNNLKTVRKLRRLKNKILYKINLIEEPGGGKFDNTVSKPDKVHIKQTLTVPASQEQ